MKNYKYITNIMKRLSERINNNMKSYKDLKEHWSKFTINGKKLDVPEYIETISGEKIELVDSDLVPIYDPVYGIVWCYMLGDDFVDVNGVRFNKRTTGAMLVSDLPENKLPENKNKSPKEETVENNNGVYLTVDEDGTEVMWAEKPSKIKGIWNIKDPKFNGSFIDLPKGTIKKLIGKKLTYKNSVYYYKG